MSGSLSFQRDMRPVPVVKLFETLFVPFLFVPGLSLRLFSDSLSCSHLLCAWRFMVTAGFMDVLPETPSFHSLSHALRSFSTELPSSLPCSLATVRNSFALNSIPLLLLRPSKRSRVAVSRNPRSFSSIGCSA